MPVLMLPSRVFKYVRASPTAVLHVLLLEGFALDGSVFCLLYILIGWCCQCLFELSCVIGLILSWQPRDKASMLFEKTMHFPLFSQKCTLEQEFSP